MEANKISLGRHLGRHGHVGLKRPVSMLYTMIPTMLHISAIVHQRWRQCIRMTDGFQSHRLLCPDRDNLFEYYWSFKGMWRLFNHIPVETQWRPISSLLLETQCLCRCPIEFLVNGDLLDIDGGQLANTMP